MMRGRALVLLLAVLCVLQCVFPVFAAEPRVLKATISDIDGRPMEGAKLFLYDSPNVRRPADFISSLSDRTGLVLIDLPSGKYWIVARFKSDGKYGPLLPGDKHSGEPLEVDMSSGAAEANFVVSDIRELGQKKRATASDALRLKGIVADRQGSPVSQVFVFASITKEFPEYPEYISAWTGEDGRFEIYVPPDVTCYLSVSRHFPLKYQEELSKPFVIEGGKIDIAIDINLTVQ